MDVNLLKDIGLTDGESKVYLALLKLGTTKTGPLISESGVSSSKVYKILDRLQTKGLVGHVIKDKTKHFTATNPNRILDYLKEKEEDLKKKQELAKKVIPELEFQQKSIEGNPEAFVYYGFKAVTNFFSNLLDEVKEKDEYFVIGAGYGDSVLGLREFFYKYHKKRAEKKVKLNMLANYDTKEKLEKTTMQNAEIRFLPQYLISNMEIVLYEDKIFIAIWTKSPAGFLIESNEAAEGFKKYFETLWKIAKK